MYVEKKIHNNSKTLAFHCVVIKLDFESSYCEKLLVHKSLSQIYL